MLRGDAVLLIEALSFRGPFPSDLDPAIRTLVAGPVDRALEQPEADLLGQTGKGPGIEAETRGVLDVRRSHE